MTVEEIKAIVVAVDADAGHYDSAYQGTAAYTVWQEIRPLPIMGDDGHATEAWSFQVDRFTQTEGDAIAAALRAALESNHRVAFGYRVDYEPDTGYIHHIFDCEGI